MVTPTDPTALVGRWIRLDRDGGRPGEAQVRTHVEAALLTASGQG